jgi:prevent-host-death family protein
MAGMHKSAGTVVISASNARENFGKLLHQVEEERRLLVIEKRGIPTAALLSIRDYVRLAAPEPEVLKAIGQKAHQNRTSNLTARQIDRIIKTTRAQRRRR